MWDDDDDDWDDDCDDNDDCDEDDDYCDDSPVGAIFSMMMMMIMPMFIEKVNTELTPRLTYFVKDGIERLAGGEKWIAGGQTSHVEIDCVEFPFGVKSENGQLVVRSTVFRCQLLSFQVVTTGFTVAWVRARLLSVSVETTH